MIIDKHSAAVDTDFVNHVAEITLTDPEPIKLLNSILTKAQLNAIIHPLVYEHEILQDDRKILKFFVEGVIAQPTFDDIFQGNTDREAYYRYLFPELYNTLHGEAPFPPGCNILTYWKRKMSLGEIHSVTMCLVCGCGIFLSDDGDSKRLAQTVKQRAMGHIDVYNRSEILTFSQKISGSNLPKKERRAFAHIIKD